MKIKNGNLIFAILYFGLIFSGCVSKLESPKDIIITLPIQDLQPFVEKSPSLNSVKKLALKKEYLTHFFSPFDKQPQHSAEELKWGLEAAYKNLGFGENLLPYGKEEIKLLEFEANLDAYPSVKKPAIITRNSNLRVLPTNKPRFYDPSQAGEGFPFDYWQNSSIYLGTPVLITHYSRSGKWAFVESGFVSGWILTLDVGILNDNQVEELKQMQDFLVVTKDLTPIKNYHQEYLESARIGMLLPLLGSTKDKYESQIFLRNSRGYAYSLQVILDQDSFAKFPMSFSSQKVAHLTQGIVGEKYGWGGMFGNRDCSMFLHDVLGNFGFYLPRNSQAQMRQDSVKGEKDSTLYFDLSLLNTEQKLESIQQNAIPFGTLLGMKGHIMLYLGQFNGQIYILHDIWGLRTLQNETQEGRKIIGKIAITPLEIGKNIQGINQEKLLIHRIYGMRNLFLKSELSDANPKR
ncbi:SH3 domain-containing C40 family peptidase [uncultured Helicobacter sp.]|uniref:SH3 domain-containing C40 family peptidase n=1 Tax=uncultured Helicobacter sp. TaxID=175537 RepID=UPI00261EEAE3|nr:SH3 domain-containing C40 family peptidase [uncultured Helicobacter sp.]